MTIICSAVALLALPSPASAQQQEERPDAAPLFGALVGGVIGGAIGAAMSRRAPHGADLVPAAGAPHPPGGKPAGGMHKGAPGGATMHKKLGK